MDIARSFVRTFIALLFLLWSGVPSATIASLQQPLSVSCFTNPSNPAQIKIAVTNLSDVATTSIQVAIMRRGDVLGSIHPTVAIPAGVAFWLVTDRLEPSEAGDQFDCIATRAEFSDGTSWTAPDAPAGSINSQSIRLSRSIAR